MRTNHWWVAVLVLVMGVWPSAARADTAADLQAAEAMRKSGKFAESAAAYSRILAASPSDNAALLGRSAAHTQAGKIKEALIDLDQLIKVNPAHAEAWFQRGVLRLSQREFALALRDLNQTIKLNPRSPTSFAYRAMVHMMAANHPEAVKDLNEALRLRPGYAAALADRGLCWERLGDRATAEADYRAALKADPKNANATNRLEKLLKGKAAPAGTKVPAAGEVLVSVAPPAAGKSVPLASRPPAIPAVAASPASPGAGAALSPRLRPESLDFGLLSPLQYQAATSAAVEAMRLVMAPMKPGQEKSFNARWGPLYLRPSPALNEYLNRLNPLLQEFLALRSELAEAAASYDRSMEEAGYAIAYGHPAAASAALDEAGRTQGLLRLFEGQLKSNSAQILALGEPPDAEEAQRRQRQAHQEAVTLARKESGQPGGAPFLRVAWEGIPEGWLQNLAGIGTDKWVFVGGSLFRKTPPRTGEQARKNPLALVQEADRHTSGTLLPAGQRFAYLRDNEERRNFVRAKNDLEWALTDHKSHAIFTYAGGDLEGYGKIQVSANLAHVSLAGQQDLAVHRAGVSRERLVASTRSVSWRGYPAYEYRERRTAPPASPETPGTTGAELYRVLVVDVGQGDQGYWLVLRLAATADVAMDERFATAKEAELASSRLRLLEDRIESRVSALLDSLEFSFAPKFPATEWARLDALNKHLEANLLPQVTEAQIAAVTPPERGIWLLREARQDRRGSAVVQTSSALVTLGKVGFRLWWVAPPVELRSEEPFAVRYGAECLTPRPDTYLEPRITASIGASAAGILEAGLPEVEVGSSGQTTHKFEAASRVVTPGRPRTNEISFSFSSGSEGGSVTYAYTWVPAIGDDDSRIPLLRAAGVRTGPPGGMLVVAGRPTDAASGASGRIAEIKHGITLLEKMLQREEADLAKETDRGRRETLEFRIMGLKSDLLAEQDLVRSLESGQLVHTRSPFDDYARQQFVQSCEREARRADQSLRLFQGGDHLLKLLPPAEAESARAFLARQLTPAVMARGDVETMRQAIGAVYKQVEGHLQAQSAKAAGQEAIAQLGVDAASNIKQAADLGMTVCAAFGGEPINVFYQGATGYVEGGPIQAVKAAVSAWSDNIDYVVTAYDEYRKGGLEAAGGAIAFKFLQQQALAYFAGRYKDSTGDGLPGPPQRPTLREQFEMAKFQQERAWGEAMVKDFSRAQQQLLEAGQRGAPAVEIMQLQRLAREKAAVLASSLPAKNHLKYQAEPQIGAAYDAHMRAVHAEVDAHTKDLMRQEGWNSHEWDLMEFRNASSHGKPNMDRDVGLRERSLWQTDADGVVIKGADGRPVPNPDAWTTGANGQPMPRPQLTRDGQPMNLHAWQEQAQKAYNKAYREVTGRSARLAQEGVTTTAHPEAYKDNTWLGDHPESAQRAWAAQAADVTRYKASHLLQHGDPGASYYTRLQEVARGTAKDMGTKLLPLIQRAKPSGFDAAGRQAASEALARSQQHWKKIHEVLEAFGQNRLDPLTATRRLRELTGGKSMDEVASEVANVMEGMKKF